MSPSQPRIFENRYQLQDRIGHGAMGEIYAAYDFLTHQTVALKRVFVNPTQIIHGSSYGSNNPAVALAQEFRLLATLRHPHIISVLDFGFDHERRPFYTMELLQNVQPINRVPTTTEGKLVLLTQLAHALAYLHRRGIVHRDLKPSNVLVENGSMTRVLDFGLARRYHQQDTSTVGTIAYMAPETLSGHPATPHSDLFSFGLIAYEVMTGHHPFDTENMVELVRDLLETEPDFTDFFASALTGDAEAEQQKTNPLFANSRASKMMRQMIPVVGKLLSKRPERRYSNAHEVIQELGRISSLTTSTTEWVAITDSYLQSAPFIGRELELSYIDRLLAKASNGTGEILLIGGESGVGKTRLLDEVRVHAVVEGMLVLRGETNLRDGLPFEAWRGPLRQLLLSVEISDHEAATLKTILPDVDDLIQRPTPNLAFLPDDTFKEQLAALVTAIFQRLQRPSVLMLEGLQADTESIGVLKALLPMVPQLPLLVIGTYRTDDGDDLTVLLPDIHHIRLPRFERLEVMSLAGSVLGEYGRAPNVLDFLMYFTDGNPYLLVETIRALAEEAGGLEQIPTLSMSSLMSEEIPVVDQLIRRRLSRLPSDARPLLDLSAVVGRSLNWDILRNFADKDTIDRWYFACTQSGVIEIHDGVPRFSSEKLREAVLDEIDTTTRQQLHELVALHFESLYPDLPSWSMALVEHWRMAGNTARMIHHANIALHYTINVGLYANTKTLGELLLAHLPPTDTHQRLHVERILGDMYLFVFELEKAGPHFVTVLTAERCDIEDRIHALYGMSQLVYLQDQNLTQSTMYLKTALALIEQHQRQDLLPMVFYGLGSTARQQDPDGAWEHYSAAVQAAQQMDQAPRFLCYALNDLGVMAYTRGDYEMAAEYFHAVCSWSEEYGAFVHIEALGNLGDLARQDNDPSAAIHYYESARELAFKVGKLAGYVHQSYNLALLSIQQSNLTAALNYIREGISFARRTTDKGLGLVVAMAGVHALRGDYETALQWIGLVQSEPADVTDWTADCHQVLMIVKAFRTPSEVRQSLLRGSNLTLENVIAQIESELNR